MKKLTLNKKTISNLNYEDLNNVIGGNPIFTDPRDCNDETQTCTGSDTCPNTAYTNCYCESKTCDPFG